MSQGKQPLATLRDGPVKVTIWENQGEKGVWYSVDPGRTYTDKDGKKKTAESFSGTDILKISRLLNRAYEYIADHRAESGQGDQYSANGGA